MTEPFASAADLAVTTRPHDRDSGRESGHHGADQASLSAARCPSTTPGTHADYDLLPYPSMPIAYTQPAHLAALGTLFGLAPPPAERARVLEFGCAAGGNIIPLAMRYPTANFLGIDLSQRHIADGKDRIADLGLDNIRLRQADLATFDPGDERFDYVICHGVFSWVPKAAQEAIFRLCQEVLAPNGIVTISYNVLPGWHLRTAIRDLCLRYAGNDDSPRRRVARARAALQRIAEASDRTDPYGLLLQTEARRLKGVPAAYILGEFLAPDNAPCHVQDFIERAAGHQLDYLCEADLFAAVPPGLDVAVRSRLTGFTGTSRSAAEQDIDFLTGRLFRSSVLVRSRPTGTPLPKPDPNRLGSLHVTSSLHLDAMRSSDGATVFIDDRARPITIRDPAVGRAILCLAEAYPGTLALADLIRDIDLADQPQIEERVRNAVFAMVMAGRADISALPLRVGKADGTRPLAWKMARIEAASGQAWVTSLCHKGLPSLPALRVLVPCLDGTRDRGALRAVLVDALQTGALAMPERPAGQDVAASATLDMMADRYLGQTLDYLGHQGLLMPESAAPTCHMNVSECD